MNRFHAHLRVPPRSTPVTKYPAFMAYADEPRPVSWADGPELGRAFLRAAIAVVLGILLAPYLYAALGALSEALS